MGNKFKVGDLVVAAPNRWGLHSVAAGDIGQVIGWEMLRHSYGPQKRRHYTVLWQSVGLMHGILSCEIQHYAD